MKSKLTKSLNVLCDSCKGGIPLDRKIFKVKKFGDLEAEYFVCRHCKSIYLVSVTDTALRLAIKMYGKGSTESIREREKWLREKHKEEITNKLKEGLKVINVDGN